MAARKSEKSREWLRVIKRDARGKAVATLLRRHGKTLDKVKWIHGTGRVAVPKAGLYLYLWKPGVGKLAAVWVVGLEFCFSGMSGGASYSGKIPFRLLPLDSIERVELKLRHKKLEIEKDRRVATATDKTHRLIAKFDRQERLKALIIMAIVPMRRLRT